MNLYEFLILVAMPLTCAFTAFLNRAAGGGFLNHPAREEGDWLLKPWLPGKPLYWIAIPFFLTAWCWNGWNVALAFTAAYVFWRLFPWGRWLGMDHIVREKGPAGSTFELVIEHFTWSEQSAMYMRMLLAVPGILLVYAVIGDIQLFDIISAIACATWLWLAYVIGWGLRPTNGVAPAEIVAGMVWGIWVCGVS